MRTCKGNIQLNVDNKTVLKDRNISAINCSSLDYCDLQRLGKKLKFRIVGGRTVSIREHPWLVMIAPPEDRRMFNCGGSLITTQWVLTAAHCIPYKGSTDPLNG